MSTISLNLPLRYRIDLKMVKRREVLLVDQKNFIPRFKDIKAWRNGNKLSRFARHMFEHKNMRRVLSSNLAVAALATTIFPAVSPAFTSNILAGKTTINVSSEPLKIDTSRGVQLPLASFHINQGFFAYHPGLDLKGAIGEPIKPVMVGTVTEADYSHFGYGNVVIVNHGDGIESLYAHMSKIFVKNGDRVDLNSVLGLVGTTGHSTGPHLHLEIREKGASVNPLRVLPIK